MSKWIVTVVDVSTDKETFKQVEGSFNSLQEALDTWSNLSSGRKKILGKKNIPLKQPPIDLESI